MTTKTHITEIRRDILESPDADDLRLILADMLRDSHCPRDVAEGEFVAASMAWANRNREDTRPSRHRVKLAMAHAWTNTAMDSHKPYRSWMLDDPTDDVAEMYQFGLWRGLPHTWAVADVPTFEAQAKDVFSRHPIRRVVLRCEVETEIWQVDRGIPHPSDCSPTLWALLDGRDRGWYKLYETDSGDDSPALARADLEAACVRYGRMVAKLPALGDPR